MPEHVAGLLGLRRRPYMDRLLRLYRHVPHTLVPHLAPWLLPRQYFGQMTALARPSPLQPPTGVRRLPPASPATPWSSHPLKPVPIPDLAILVGRGRPVCRPW